jgi:hypothetical protein
VKSIRYKIREAKIIRIMRTIDTASEGLDKMDKVTLLHNIRHCVDSRISELCPHGVSDPSDCAVCCGLRKEEAS